jgi:dienelactone hydrolase
LALLQPEQPHPSGAAIIALHGYDGNLESMIEDVDYHHGMATKLARQGYTVLAPHRVASTIVSRNACKIKV